MRKLRSFVLLFSLIIRGKTNPHFDNVLNNSSSQQGKMIGISFSLIRQGITNPQRVFFASCLLIIFPVDPGHFPDVLYIFHFFFLDPQRCLGVFLFCICCNTPFSCPSQISSCKI